MSPYLPSPEDRWATDQSDLRRRVATLEQLIAQGAGAYGAFPCTSSTRPASPRLGQEIYETDTTRFLIWSGSAWEQKAFATFTCTSSTRPASPFTGLEIYETDTGSLLVWSGSAWAAVGGGSLSWTTYTPTLALGGTLGTGVLYGAYCKSGTYCTVRVTFLWGSTTSISGAISINLPFTAATVTAPGVSTPIMWTGSAQAWIAAANNRAGVAIITNGAAYFQATSDNIPSQWTPSTPVTIATNDHLCFEITYQTV